MSWDSYFHDVCKTIGANSKCLSRKIGAILVKDKSIISTGYNGPPRGVMQCSQRWAYDLMDKDVILEKKTFDMCPRYVLGYKSGEGLDICIAGHAERNALINAARHGVETKGSIMYMDCGVPCIPCLVEIINAGVEEIVFTSWKIYEKNVKTTEFLLAESGLEARTYSHCRGEWNE